MHRRLLSSVAPSFRARLWFLVLVVALPSLSLSTWMIRVTYRNERRAMERHLLDGVHAYASLFEAEIRERVAILQSLVLSTPFTAGDFTALRERARTAVLRPGEWVIVADESGNEWVNTRDPSREGVERLAIAPETLAAMAEGRPQLSNLIGGESPGGYHVVITLSGRMRDGRRVVLALAMTPAALINAIVRTRLSPDMVLAVMDRNRTVVARSRALERFAGVKASATVLALAAEKTEAVADSTTLDGHPSIVAFTILPGSGWGVMIAGHKSELLEPAKEMVLVALGVTALVCAFVIGSAFWVARVTGEMAAALITDTQALARGERVEVRRTGMAEGDAVSQALAATSRELAARQTALENARDEALAASRTKDEFLAALSHELRTPLNPVLLIASESARDPALPADQRELFTMIEKNVMHEARLIDDLLELTRISTGRMSLRLGPVDFDGAVSDAVATFRPRLREKQIELKLRLGAPAVRVRADAVRLHQVLVNVLGNAIKFTPEAGIIRVATQVDEVARSVSVEISDTGIGMNAEEMARIFDKFVQGDHARPGRGSRYGGLGLGLAISRNIVELHGGRISAASEGSGRGSTFTVVLPLENASSATA